MKILLLGATGRLGKLVLKTALENDVEVFCLARNSQRIERQKGLTVYEGSPLNKVDLEKSISGCDAIISTLNISRESDFPWSKLRTPEKFMSEVMEGLIPIAKKFNINRIVICSAWGVFETKNNIPRWFRWLINNSNVGIGYKDHERQEEVISKSGLDWTIVRPVALSNSNKKENIKETFDNEPKPGLWISRQSVASFLVNSLKRSDLIEKRVVISKE